MSRRPRERSGASARTAGAEPASAVRTPSSTQHVHDNMPSSTVPGNEAWFDALTCNSKDVPISAAARSMALNIGEGPITRMVHDLVRLSLFTEYQRSPLRRDAIVKKVLEKETTRIFPVILAGAQQILRTTFGFELVEMRVRGAENPLLAEQAKALDGRVGTKRRRTEENNESSSRKAISSATAYILRSTLPSNVIQALTMSSSTASSMVDWRQTEDETGSMGLLFVILSLILLSGRQVGEGKLRAYLAQLSLFIDRPLPTAIQTHGARTVDDLADARRGHNEQSNLESFLQQMQRYGYLEKVRVAASAETPSAPSFEWRWGARAELEIGEAGVAAFVTDLYQNGAKSENENVASELRRRIERAAGTPLVG